MEKVQNLKSSNTAPSSKTFRDESPAVVKHLSKWNIDLYLVSFILYIYYVFVCFLMLTCAAVFVLGCNWPYLAVVKHVNKLIELN
jgi:hypothetical protein